MFQVRKRFLAGELTKHEYNAELHALHGHLFEYVEFIKGTGIGRIEVTEEGVIMSSRDGVRFLCDPNDRHQTVLTALNFGAYEAADMALLNQMVRPDSVVYDVGANMGWYTLHLARRHARRAGDWV